MNIFLENAPHRKTVLDLEAQCRVVELAGDDPLGILGRGKLVLVIGEARHVRARDDSALLEAPNELFTQLVEPAPDTPPSIVRVHEHIGSVIPRAVGIVVGALMRARDLCNRVLRVREIEIEKNSAALPDNALAVETNKEPLREGLGVNPEILFRDEVGRSCVRKSVQLERGALRREIVSELNIVEHDVTPFLSRACWREETRDARARV